MNRPLVALAAALSMALVARATDAQTAAAVGAPSGVVRIDTVASAALGARKALRVYLPPSYATSPARRYPVAYYLHGLWGDETNWQTLGRIDRTLDSLAAAGVPEMIVVMPDGDDGWYTTWAAAPDPVACAADTTRREPAASFCVPHARYDDYLVRDVLRHVDATYRTLGDRAHRGIAGLSMGGFGALTIALAHPDLFAAAASHSGVIAPLYAGPHPFAEDARWAASPDSLRGWYGGVYPSLARALGADTASWWARDPARLAVRAARTGAGVPALYVDVGVDDRVFVDQSRAFRAALERARIPLTYAEWPGTHSWAYWRAHVGESLAWTAAHLGRASP